MEKKEISPFEVEMTMQLAEHRIERCEQTVAAARQSGKLHEEGTALLHLGVAHSSVGKLNEAIENCVQALTISRELSDRQMEADVLSHLATAYRLKGQVMRATKLREQAIAVHREIGNRLGEAEQLNSLGVLFLSLETPDSESAIKHVQLALSIYRELGDRQHEALSLSNLGTAYLLSEKPELARRCLEQSLSVSREIGDRDREANVLYNLATLHLQVEQAERARECGQQALSVSREIGDREKEARILLNLGTIYTHLKQEEKAIEATQAALQILDETGGPEAAEARERLDHLRNPKWNMMASVTGAILVVVLIVAYVGVRVLFASWGAKSREFQDGFWPTASALQTRANLATIEPEGYVSFEDLYRKAPTGLTRHEDWEQWENEYAGKYAGEKGRLTGLAAYPKEGKLFLIFTVFSEEDTIENDAAQVALLVEDAHRIELGEKEGSFLIDGIKSIQLGEDYSFEGKVSGYSLFDTELAGEGHGDLIIVKGRTKDIVKE
jgi:tetratricopeptide (TPR) repeat protein